MTQLTIEALPPGLASLGRRAGWVAVAALALSAVQLFFHGELFFRAYLFSWLLLLGAALGSLGLVMLHNLVGGDWGLAVRRPAEAAALTLPLVALLFLPILAGLGHLYIWAVPEEVAKDAVLKHRQGYLNPVMFGLRAVIYLAAWSFLAWQVGRRSLAVDRSGDPRAARRLRDYSRAGLVVYALTMSLAAVDWIMSREAHWYSSILGFLVIVGQVLTGTAFVVALLWPLRSVAAVSRWLRPGTLNDLGNLLLTLVVLWAYMGVSQLVIIWMGNTQEDVSWYVHRVAGGWRFVAGGLIALHFFVPFLLLLSRDAKRRLEVLTGIAVGLLVMRVVDLYWLIAPSGVHHHEPGMHLSWVDLTVLVGLAGLWLAVYLRVLAGRPLATLPRPQGGADEAASAPEVKPPLAGGDAR